jgi:hypothetical protein
MPEV